MKNVKRIVSVLLCAALVFSFASCGKNEGTKDTTKAETTENNNLSSNIDIFTGKAVSQGKENTRPISIVVENLSAARPQWGITTPDILMEYEVEGGITRMLWLYSDIDKVPDKVGPIRSARHDAVELALGLNAVFVHNGYSYIAEALINKYSDKLNNVNGLFSPPCFYRDKTRNVAIEHTSCLDGKSFKEYVASQGISLVRNSNFVNPFTFTGEGAPRKMKDGVCNSLYISYSSSFDYTFKYDEALAKYKTNIADSPMVDENGEQCKYNNVIVLYVDMVAVGSSSGHQDLLLEKGGEGIIASCGTYEKITWKKGGDTEPLELFSSSGEKLQINSGNSYIGFVRSTQSDKTVIA